MTLLAKVVEAGTDQRCEMCLVRAVLLADVIPPESASGRFLVCQLHGRILMMVLESCGALVLLDEHAEKTLNWKVARPVGS